jgi:hypothetical protein
MKIDEPHDTSPHPTYSRDAAEHPAFVYMRCFRPTGTAEYKLRRKQRMYDLERRVRELERKILD